MQRKSFPLLYSLCYHVAKRITSFSSGIDYPSKRYLSEVIAITNKVTPQSGSPISTQMGLQKRITQTYASGGTIGPIRHTPTVANMKFNYCILSVIMLLKE